MAKSMTPEEYEDILYENRILRWSARILGTMEAAFLFYLAVSEFWEEIDNHSANPLQSMIGGQYLLAVTLAIVFTGLVIAWWREGLGGGIALAGWVALLFGWKDSDISFILGIGLAALPAALFVAYRISVDLAISKAEGGKSSEQ